MANKKLDVYYHGLHVGTLAEMQHQLVQKKILGDSRVSFFVLSYLFEKLLKKAFLME